MTTSDYSPEDGQRVEKGVFTSNKEGKVDFKDFKFDENYNYELVETKTIEKYRLDQKPIKIYLKDEAKKESFNGIVSAYMENELQKGRIIISKYSEDKKESLAGAEFSLYKVDAEGNKVDKPLKVATTDARGFIEFRDLELGKYIVKETKAPQGYRLLDEEHEFVLTTKDSSQSIVVNNPINKMEIPVEKIWDDNENQDGKRPDEITVKLLADGEVLQTVKLTAKNEWKYVFKDLDIEKIVDENGVEVTEKIKYTIEEVKVADYETAIDGSGSATEGFVITNKHTPATTNIKVQKTWTGVKDNNLPGSIEIELLANGKAIDKKLSLNADNSWSGEFSNLPVFELGKEIEYSIKEVGENNLKITVNGNTYTVTYSGDKGKGFVINNEKEPEETTTPTTTPTTPKETTSTTTTPTTPKETTGPTTTPTVPPTTGERIEISIGVSVLLLTVAAVLIAVKKKREE